VFAVGDCAMSWRATLQPVVAKSTNEADYMAIIEACKESVWLKGLYVELCGDNACVNLYHERTKHIDVKYTYVRDIVAQGKLKVCKISTYDNPTDIMTKPVPVAKFDLCSNLVGITV
jgi:hypothetical protein